MTSRCQDLITQNLKKGWELIRQGLDIDDPALVDRCLGCHHPQLTSVVNGKLVNIMQYKVKDFIGQCAQPYKDLCGEPDMKLRHAEAPFIASPDGEGVMHQNHLKKVGRLGLCSPLLVRF